MTFEDIYAQRIAEMGVRKRKYMKLSARDTPVIEEMRACFGFFYDNFYRQGQFGLMPDSLPDIKHKSSIASTGFMLAAMAVGADFGWIEPSEAKSICDATLNTLSNIERDHGFFYHFYDPVTGKRYNKCELSTIDTGLLLCGALTAGNYFGSNTIKMARKLAAQADWEYFYDPDRKLFRMARYDNGMQAWWDYYAEQLVLYVLAAANDAPFARQAYESFGRLHGKSADGTDFVYAWFGTLFTYQFSHAFVDFQGKRDGFGFDWFTNSVTATVNDRLFCASQPYLYPNGIWGLTSCAVPGGYKGHIGSSPSGNDNTENLSEGTVAPCAALGSIVFTPDDVFTVLDEFRRCKDLTGPYGLYDSFNPTQGWVAKRYIGIDKGITLLMCANYYKRTVWKSFSSLSEIRRGLKNLGFTDAY